LKNRIFDAFPMDGCKSAVNSASCLFPRSSGLYPRGHLLLWHSYKAPLEQSLQAVSEVLTRQLVAPTPGSSAGSGSRQGARIIRPIMRRVRRGQSPGPSTHPSLAKHSIPNHEPSHTRRNQSTKHNPSVTTQTITTKRRDYGWNMADMACLSSAQWYKHHSTIASDVVIT
jgi:hypothetical protein